MNNKKDFFISYAGKDEQFIPWKPEFPGTIKSFEMTERSRRRKQEQNKKNKLTTAAIAALCLAAALLILLSQPKDFFSSGRSHITQTVISEDFYFRK